MDQQIHITCDMANGQDKEQQFAYIVQIHNSEGTVIYLNWITGTLSPEQSFSPSLSWIPTEPGMYTATVFVWESAKGDPLNSQISTIIDVEIGI